MLKVVSGKARGAVAGLALALASLALGGCGSSDDDTNYTEQPVELLYNRALDALGQQDYQSNKYDDAIIALDRFIQLHPGHRDIPYAYYLKALCYYEQISDIGRDQRITQQALDALAEVVKRFPESPYARDARLKVELAIDHLAGKEMAVGRYYQANQQYIGAINRYRVVIERYQTTTHVPEALHRLVESYLSLGVKSEAQEAAAVLGYNFPGSDWYQDSYYLMTGEGSPAPVDERRWFFGLF